MTSNQMRVLWGCLLLCVSIAALEAALRDPAVEARVADRPARVASDGYVSSNACRACHPSQYASWHASWHRTMTQVASPESVIGDFEARSVRAYGHDYALERRGDDFFVATSAAPERGWQRVVMTTGAHHEQDYWLESGEGRRTSFLPLMYLVEDARWIPFTAGFLRPPVEVLPPAEALDKWHYACIKCHATHGKPRFTGPHAGRVDTTVAELGIGCEACHGPAGSHADANRNPLRRYVRYADETRDDTVVHPGRLPADRASEICGQCHGISRPLSDLPVPERGPGAPDWRETGLPYRPGDVLAQTRHLVRPGDAADPFLEALRAGDPHYLEDRFWADGEVRVSGREYNGLLASPCFERGAGERKLSCLSCHEMHTPARDASALRAWADDQLAPGMRGNAACVGCHARFDDAAARRAHTRHAAGSSGSQCMNCHMPYTTYGLLKAMRSHTISSPSVATTRDTGRPNACNLCHLDRSAGWAAEALAEGWDQPLPELPPVLAQVPLSMVWLLGGDAGQRALFAWAMGWAPALEASGEGGDFAPAFLAPLLVDPYPAVRYIAARSLRAQPGLAALDYDFVGPEDARSAVAREVAARWAEVRQAAGRPTDPQVLVDDPDALLPADLFGAILSQRNERRVDLAE